MIKTHFSLRLLLIVTSLLIACVISEIFLRFYGQTNKYGEFFIRGLICPSYEYTSRNLSSRLKPQLTGHGSFVQYDPHLGWDPKNVTSKNGLYSFNQDGIRTHSTNVVIPTEPKPEVLRIAVFGDSFTMGEDVIFENTWDSFLTYALGAHGISTETINFGFRAFGIDQAFLRWELTGKKIHPRVVILGLQLENIYRNGNLIRAFYVPVGLPLSKPRFILEDKKLKLINVPPPRPEEIENIIEDFSSWPYSKFELWYDSAVYNGRVFFKSRLISFVYAWFQEKIGKTRLRQDQLIDLSLEIILKFKQSVEETGAKFYVVYLPVKHELVPMLSGHQAEEQRLVDLLKKAGVDVIDPSQQLLDQIKKTTLMEVIPYHYTPSTNKIIAQTIAARMTEQ